MNKVFPALLLPLGFSLLVLPANAESDCFLIPAGGRAIDLSHLCGTSTGPVRERVFRLPFVRRHNGIPVVAVTINGRETFQMLFDTGASGIVLTQQMADKVGVRILGKVRAKTAGGTILADIGRVSTVTVGDLTVSDSLVGVSPHLEGMGLLGQSFFGPYNITIKESVIELRPRQ